MAKFGEGGRKAAKASEVSSVASFWLSHDPGMTNKENKFQSIGMVSKHFGVPRAWLKREADAGRLPCLRVGRRRMFAPEAVRVELERRARGEFQHPQNEQEAQA